jgi:biopolymer transport protein ExbB/TolQ
MNSVDMVVNFFQQGGAFLYPIAAVFAVGIAVAIERFIFLSRVGGRNRRLWSELAPHIQAGNFRQALELAERSDAPLSIIMKYGISRIPTAHRQEDIERAVGESLIDVVLRVEKRTHQLSSLANIGMLMGLLGTVIGLINAFAAVANVNPAERTSLLSASISVAMNNTALGLGLAITLLLAHMYLESKTTALVNGLEVASMKFLNSVAERRGESQRTLSPAQVAAQLGAQAGQPVRAARPR